MFETIRKILKLLLIGEQRKFYWLVAAIVVMTLFEIVGLASIFPFLSVISNPGMIQTSHKLKWIYDTMGFTSQDTFLLVLAAATFVIMVANNLFRAAVSVAVIRFTWLKRYLISKQLLSQYLYEPYAFFLNRNSSQLLSYLVSEVGRLVSGVLIPVMQIFARSLLALLILVLLIIVDPIVAIVVTLVMGGGYAIVYLFVRKILSESGQNFLAYSNKMYKVLNEAFGGIKDIKLLGKERAFIDEYSVPVRKMVNCYSSQFLVAQIPRYAFEVMAFGGILAMTIYLVVIKKDHQHVIPLVGLYALAAYRLMPTLQQIFADLTNIRFSRAALETIYDEFFHCTYSNNEEPIGPISVLPFTRAVEFRDITFQYPKAQKPVIEDLNMSIKANTTVGFVGETGAGKTTLVDVFLGLLSSQQGEIIVDGTKLNRDNLRAWQANVGYVPQHIYLCDDSITRNIAFGVPDHKIDRAAVQCAAQIADIHSFIINELPNGYETEVGERGIRLSGGQRQRVGIARAMYHNPSLLVFDEATSALDGITEDVIMEAIHNLTHKKTIIIIAHRLSTVRECDVIYLLERGKIIAEGKYQELLATNQQFRKMAKEYEKNNNFSRPVTNISSSEVYE